MNKKKLTVLSDTDLLQCFAHKISKKERRRRKHTGKKLCKSGVFLDGLTGFQKAGSSKEIKNGK